ncbi:Bug family tripartite tricarboxylate transporter substrate binding protein [Sabulicella glaciei]|uniref:Tripartite tricarboxylate transporter substrate binding protein n=1 Tax=Sabulicella glaciei TaxID=2984948 RepID=A0ABT3NQV7_9PROT|nr:tripartite tricarboxylate transporter substrate binding protein [Roseococcus sp. MDT2-1-1]MCW8084545.1 tripartite tricarboxylate transporter substrate binding protein [Roseococcus sp. MDT2-1-1]
MIERRALLASPVLLALPARAQAWPGGQTVSVVLPYSPGGSTDVLGRILTQGLSERLGGTFIMDHKPGATTTLGARHVARARPDGHTLFLGTVVSFTMAPFALRNIGYDPVNDFAHLTMLAETGFVLVAHPRTPTVQSLVEAAKARPGQLSYATWGVGSSSHLLMLDFMRRTGTDMLHVPFNGSPPGLTETMAGRIDAMMTVVAPARPQIEGGRLAGLAIPSAVRLEALPDVQTVEEVGTGLAGMRSAGWFSLQAPAGTPQPIQERLAQAAAESFRTPAAKAQLAQLGFLETPPGPGPLRARIGEELALHRDLMARAGIQPE